MTPDLLNIAKHKMGVIKTHLNDSTRFAAAVHEFELWLEAHKGELGALALDASNRAEIKSLIQNLTRLENQAQQNAQLMRDMQTHFGMHEQV